MAPLGMFSSSPSIFSVWAPPAGPRIGSTGTGRLRGFWLYMPVDLVCACCARCWALNCYARAGRAPALRTCTELLFAPGGPPALRTCFFRGLDVTCRAFSRSPWPALALWGVAVLSRVMLSHLYPR